MGVRGISLLLFAGICWAALLPTMAGDKKTTANTPNYYPLEVGNTWHSTTEVKGRKTKTVFKVARMEKEGDEELAVVEASIDSRVVATEYLQQTDKGIFRHKYNGVAIEPPFRMLAYPLAQKWEGTVSAGDVKGAYNARSRQEEVEVPAGKFKAVRVDFDLLEKGNKVATSYWFVENMGFVKQTVEAGPVSVVHVLEKFTPAKK